MSYRCALLTVLVIAVYLAVMASTNHVFTILDDESIIITVAGHPILPTLRLFLEGGFQHEHPPASDILLHVWLIVTHYSFFALRIFANIFYALGVLFTALSARRLAGTSAYWACIILGFAWPFAFQYGRITGWYCCSFFLVALATWLYVHILENRSYWFWLAFILTAVVSVWTNYFAVAILGLLLLDLLIFHRRIAREKIWLLLISAGIVILSYLPLLHATLTTLGTLTLGIASRAGLERIVAETGYPLFAIFGSAAVAPWFLPLSIPVIVATAALLISIWFSPGRKWLVYFVLSMWLLELSGHMNIKRVLFLLPWMFIAMALAAFGSAARFPRLASAAAGVIVIAGWIGIASGKHYATTNLYEPWNQVAQVVAGDARSGATVISDSYPFFFYLNYQLGVESETQAATGPDLGEFVYKSHGYKVFEADGQEARLNELRGKVVLVSGSSMMESIQWTRAVEQRLQQQCQTLGQYRAAPDPAVGFKAKYAAGVPVLPYRIVVTWFDCGR